MAKLAKLAKLAKKYGMHLLPAGVCKQAPRGHADWDVEASRDDNMATAFSKRGGDPGRTDDAQIDKLHSKIGQRVVERGFLANASVQLLGTRGKKW